MSDPVLDRPDIERKFGIFTYNKVKNYFTNNKHYKGFRFQTTNCLNLYFVGWQLYTHDGGNTGKRGPNPGKAS
jgi:hypothetical protein